MEMFSQYADAVLEFTKNNQGWIIPVVFAFAFAESLAFLSLVVPSTVILVGISGLLGASGVSFWPVWLAAGIGGSLGYALSYWIGLYFKDSIHTMWPFTKYPQMIPKGQQFFDKYGVFGVFLGHFFGPVRAVIPVVAGMYAMKQIPFQIANVSSAFLWAAGVMGPAAFGMQWFLGTN